MEDEENAKLRFAMLRSASPRHPGSGNGGRSWRAKLANEVSALFIPSHLRLSAFICGFNINFGAQRKKACRVGTAGDRYERR
jgi:hypothetical protein